MSELANWLGAKLDALIGWLRDLVVSVLTSLFDLAKDVVVWIIDTVGGAIVTLFGALQVPAGISGGLASVFGGMPPTMQWIAGALGIGTCLSVVGAAYGVRLLRKIVTLFQY